METVEIVEINSPAVREDVLVERLRLYLFDDNLQPIPGRKETLLTHLGDATLPLPHELTDIFTLLYEIAPERRIDYVNILIKRIVRNVGTLPKNIQTLLFRQLDTYSLEQMVKAKLFSREAVDAYYDSLINSITDPDKRFLFSALRRKDWMMLQAISTTNRMLLPESCNAKSFFQPIGNFDPFLYLFLNNRHAILWTFSNNADAWMWALRIPIPQRAPYLCELLIRAHADLSLISKVKIQGLDNRSITSQEIQRLSHIAHESCYPEALFVLHLGACTTAVQNDDKRKINDLIGLGIPPHCFMEFATNYEKTNLLKYLVVTTPRDELRAKTIQSGTFFSTCTLLQYACKIGDAYLVATFIEIEPESINRGATSPLWFACRNLDHENALHIATLLITKGADVNAASVDRDGRSETPLQAAANAGNQTLVNYLIQNGANALDVLSKKEIQNISFTEKNIRDMLDKYIAVHPKTAIAQRLRNSVNGVEPSLTWFDKFRLIFAPTLGKIYRSAKKENLLTTTASEKYRGVGTEEEKTPLLAEVKLKEENSPRKIVSATAARNDPGAENISGTEPDFAANNNNAPPVEFPHSTPSASTPYWNNSKLPEEVFDNENKNNAVPQPGKHPNSNPTSGG